MRRREFIALLGGATVLPVSGRAEPVKTRRIGFLGAASPAVANRWLESLVTRLRELGWVDGRNISIEARWAEGREERAVAIAAEFTRQNVDVIVTWATEPALIAKRATATIPIVFALATDPVGSGLVSGLARPGGNITGLSALNLDLVGKRFELLSEIVPNLRSLAVLANINVADTAAEMRDVEAIADRLGLNVLGLPIRQADDIVPAFDVIKSRSDALFVVGDPLTFTNRVKIIQLANAARLPTMYAIKEFVVAGGLISYGPNFPDLFRRAGDFVDKILRGTRPSDIPVEQPTKFDLVINLVTAKALGINVPPVLLARADEVIE